MSTMTEPRGETANAQNGVSISMKKLVEGVNIVFNGIVTMLESITPASAAEQLIERNLHKAEDTEQQDQMTTDSGQAINTSDAEATADEGHTADAKASEETQQEAQVTTPSSPPSEPAVPSVTVDDITKVIVAKLKQNRSNNGPIGQLLKSYKAARVSDLKPEQFEAFLTDLSQI